MNLVLRETLKVRGAGYGGRERSEVFHSGSQDAEYHGPVDFLVGMNGYVSESYGAFHARSEIHGNHSEPFQLLKCFGHGGGCGEIRIGDNVGGEIDANLDSTLQIDADNILEIPIVQQWGYRFRCFILETLDASPQRFELRADDFLIH
jgi:hypothetical protein